MLHHVTGACCIQHTVSQTARTIFSFVLFHLFNILICLKFYCHFSAITPNWNLTKKKVLFSWFSTTKLIQCDIPQHSKLAQLVLLLTHIQEMPSSNLSKHVTHPNWGVSWFLPTPSGRYQHSTSNYVQPLLSTSFPIYCLLITLSELNLMKPSLNKQQIKDIPWEISFGKARLWNF